MLVYLLLPTHPEFLRGLERNKAVRKLGFHHAHPCHTAWGELTCVYEKKQYLAQKGTEAMRLLNLRAFSGEKHLYPDLIQPSV